MIQMQTNLVVADNSGAKMAKCIKVLGGTKRMFAGLGDIVVVAIQESIPGSKVKKGDVKKAVIIRLKDNVRREDGSYVKFDDNSIVLLSNAQEPFGTRIFGPVARELRNKSFTKICSLAPEVI